MLKQKGRLLFLFMFIVSAFKSWAQPIPGRLAFKIIDDIKEVSNHYINDILQDSRGFMWIGTDYGLNRYDGIHCRVWLSSLPEENGGIIKKLPTYYTLS